ncbi:hypothetical protein BS78_04G213000 [Paspalum vaginatum]|nr:hypothetical protein BS78_04G213000 [Paspalum vaginatum]
MTGQYNRFPGCLRKRYQQTIVLASSGLGGRLLRPALETCRVMRGDEELERRRETTARTTDRSGKKKTKKNRGGSFLTLRGMLSGSRRAGNLEISRIDLVPSLSDQASFPSSRAPRTASSRGPSPCSSMSLRSRMCWKVESSFLVGAGTNSNWGKQLTSTCM